MEQIHGAADHLHAEFPSVSPRPKLEIVKSNGSDIDSENALTWPEGTPSVAMDTDLGERGYNDRQYRINFDMAKYYELLSKQKLSPEQKSKIQLLIHDTQFTELGSYTLGEHRIKEDTTHVRFIERSGDKPQPEDANLEMTNNTLLHETKHVIQDQKGRLPETDFEAALMWYGLRYVVPLGVLATGVTVYKTTGIEYAPTVEGTIAAHIVGRMLTGYRFRICEISARRFARRNMDAYGDIITTGPK